MPGLNVPLRGAWGDFPYFIKSIALSGSGKPSLSSVADSPIAKHNEIFGELAAGRLPAKIFCNAP